MRDYEQEELRIRVGDTISGNTTEEVWRLDYRRPVRGGPTGWTIQTAIFSNRDRKLVYSDTGDMSPAWLCADGNGWVSGAYKTARGARYALELNQESLESLLKTFKAPIDTCHVIRAYQRQVMVG